MLNNDGHCEDLDEISASESNPSSKTETWSGEDKELIGPCTGLVKTARSLLKKTQEATRLHGNCAEERNIAQLDDLVSLVDKLSPSVDNLISSLYPPLDHAIIGNLVN